MGKALSLYKYETLYLMIKKNSAVLLIESGKFPRFLVPSRVFVFSCGLSFSTVEFIKETPIFFF